MTDAQVAALPPLARVRFDLAGAPLECVSSSELRAGTRVEDVVSRDPLRKAEGAVAEGYTIEEACLLLRAGHVPLQRAGAPLCDTPAGTFFVLHACDADLSCGVGPGGTSL